MMVEDTHYEVRILSLAGEGRKREILELLDISGKVKVRELSEMLKVSTETIRRYLEELHEDGKLKKVYGGAIKTSFYNEEPTSIEREIINAEEKNDIGLMAVNIVNDNDVIAIDDGSTPLQLAKNLRNKRNLTILTTSVTSLTVLTDLHYQNLFSGKIIILGGEINTNHHRITGPLTLQMLDNLYVDKYFISADGVSLKEGITGYDYSKGMVTKKLMQHADKSILLIDSTKINKRTHYKMADLADINMVISDKDYPAEWEETLKKNNTKWLVADHSDEETGGID